MTKGIPSDLNKAKKELVKKLSGETGFVGAGIGSSQEGGLEIVVFVAEENSPVLLKIPKEWMGYPVRVQVTGTPQKY